MASGATIDIAVKSEPGLSEPAEEISENVKKKDGQFKEEEIWIKSEIPEVHRESENSPDPDKCDSSDNNEEVKTHCIKIEIEDLKPNIEKLEEKKGTEDEEKSASTEKTPEENKDAAEKPKMETLLMYSYEITKNIEIVTINEEERQKEHKEVLQSRKHMRHVCEDCAVGYVVEDAYLMHMRVHSKAAGEHECELCHSFLKTPDMLYKHRLRHYRRYRCLLCWTRFKDKDSAACHVMNEHAGQAFVCEHCGRGFKRPQYLKRHVEQYHTKPRSLECGVCSRVFHERGWYRSHIRTHNEEVKLKTVKLPVSCPLCSRDLKSKSSLKRHLLIHDAENVSCEICYEICKNRQTLMQHCLKVHNEEYKGAPEETCPQCLRVCATRAMLKRHISRMHSDRTKKYQCDHCQRLYLTKGEVRAHITWSHLPARARGGHACGCGRVFRTPSLRREHEQRVHARLPPPRVHKCELCGKAFSNKQVLNRHVKGHSNEMYPCKECGMLFKTQPYVKVHYQLKHLNMTRAQINEQRKLNKRKLNTIQTTTNWEPQISHKIPSREELDPLMVGNETNDITIKMEKMDEDEDVLAVPLFQTFIVD